MRKKIEKIPRCNALSGDGIRCRKHSAIEFDYHGDYELFNTSYRGKGEQVSWVRVNLCVDHAIGVGYDFTAPLSQRGVRAPLN